MDTSHHRPHSRELLSTPVRTDADVLARVGAIVDEEARKLQTLWLFFLNRDGMQSDVVVPIDDVPDLPDPQLVGNVCYIVSQVLSGEEPEGAAIIALSRPGGSDLGETDRYWLSALQQGAARHDTPVRMLCLATPEGIRELGPVGTAT
jgi:hypothetical protein